MVWTTLRAIRERSSRYTAALVLVEPGFKTKIS